MAGALRLGDSIEPAFYGFLRRERPDLLPLYARIYPRVSALRAGLALSSETPPLLPTEEPAQLPLWNIPSRH